MLGVVGLGTLGILSNNVSSSDYTAVITAAILSSSLALLLTVLSWSRSSRAARFLLASFAFPSVLTLVDAAGRRLPPPCRTLLSELERWAFSSGADIVHVN